MRTTGSATRPIAAPPHVVWSLVADITRMGEWSPECIGGSWLDGATGSAVGAKFEGHNKAGESTWQTTSEVIDSVPGKSFAFRTGDADMWRYAIDASADGLSCTVTESFDLPILADPPEYIPPGRDDALDAAAVTTLERLASVAERPRLVPTKEAIDLGIVVRDSGAALRFYRDTLGFTHVADMPMPRGGGTMHRLMCGSTLIKLVKFDKVPGAANPAGGLAGASGYRYFTISVGNLADMVSFCGAAGYNVATKPTEIRPGVTIALIDDPDGNTVELLQIANP